jgi:hypothetical protein
MYLIEKEIVMHVKVNESWCEAVDSYLVESKLVVSTGDVEMICDDLKVNYNIFDISLAIDTYHDLKQDLKDNVLCLYRGMFE